MFFGLLVQMTIIINKTTFFNNIQLAHDGGGGNQTKQYILVFLINGKEHKQ